MKDISATKKGLIIGGLLIVLSACLFYVFKLPENGSNQYAVLLLFIAGVIWALVDYKRKAATTAGFKDYFNEGFRAFIVVTLLMVVYTFVFYKLNPQILENAIKENNTLVMKEGNRTAAEIDANSDKLRSIFMPMMLIITTIKFLILGALVAVIGAGFLSQNQTRKG
jgi:hypothetical protein